jgi:hypothetical protein
VSVLSLWPRFFVRWTKLAAVREPHAFPAYSTYYFFFRGVIPRLGDRAAWSGGP